MSDSYPGDSRYTQIIEVIRTSAATDRISMQFWHSGAILSRTELCQLLADRHNNGRNTNQRQTNREFLSLPLTRGQCLEALTRPSGYSSSQGWQAWAGRHSGTWYGGGQQFTDGAQWHPPRREPTVSPRTDVDSNGQPRMYDFQSVEFLGRSGAARFGWNQSHAELPYVWGWDPKEGADERGQNGAHIGFPFTAGVTSCILWLTSKEAFLECIRPAGAGRRRTSVGLFGFGQWEVQ